MQTDVPTPFRLPFARAFVTGAAGFVGSNLIDALLSSGIEVVGWDGFMTGQDRFLASAAQNGNFALHRGDVLDLASLTAAMAGCDFVFHFSANADVRHGLSHPRRDLEQNTLATHNVLEAMRANGIRRIAFASTGSVYGEPSVFPTTEDAPFPVQTSLYAASKLAGEAFISAYCEGYGFESYLFRFVSILGERYTHGHVFDFCRQLRSDASRLRVLGDGTQRKSYLHVGDCVSAILTAIASQAASRAKHRTAIFNLATDEYCTVKDSVGWITAALGLAPRIEFAGGDRGWAGDNPFIFLATERIRSLGWRPKLSIAASIARTVRWLQANSWVFDEVRS